MAKVMVVLATELTVLPVAYGFWLDVCTLLVFQGSLQHRLALLRSAPLTWTLLHWMLGMACLMITAAFLSVARSILRPGRASSRDTMCVAVCGCARLQRTFPQCAALLWNPCIRALHTYLGPGLLCRCTCCITYTSLCLPQPPCCLWLLHKSRTSSDCP